MTRRWRTGTALAGALLAGSAARLPAQISASLDLASGNATYDGQPATNIVTLAPSLQFQHDRFQFGAAGNYTSFERGGWSGQGSLAGSWFTGALGPLVGELSARGDHSARATGSGTRQALAFARAHLVGEYSGLWAGTARGHAWQGGHRDAVERLEAGAWTRIRDTRWSLGITRGTRFDSVITISDPNNASQGADTSLSRVRLGYTEATLGMDWVAGPIELAGAVARRMAVDAPSTSWQFAATYWLTPYVGVIAGGGRYSADPWQAHPGGQYVTVSLRVGFQPAVKARFRSRSATPPEGLMGLDVIEASQGQWVLRVRAPYAQLVEVMGDFTDWQAVRLSPNGDGYWTSLMPLTPGTYRLNVRVNGGVWAVPPGLGTAEDEFSGRVALVVVARS